MLLVIDAGTSSVRAAVVDESGDVLVVHQRPTPPSSPAPGLVEHDTLALAEAALDVAHQTAAASPSPVVAVGVANQRATTVVWERSSGHPVGPALGWQDLRTVGRCLELAASGVRVAPNATATKAEWLIAQSGGDPDDLCIGTIDSWLVWNLTDGARHVTDHSNAGVTGLVSEGRWGGSALDALGIPPSALPELVDTAGTIGQATALPGAPPITALVGDQQASLAGQGCVVPGLAKITFGTGAMLDVCVGERPDFDRQGSSGTFPIVCWRVAGQPTWGVEAAMLSAGAAVDWLHEGLGLVASAGDTAEVAAGCSDTGDVWFVPALGGLGAPHWDFGATGTFVGITRGTGRAQMVRAVLHGIAHRGADLVDAAEADTGLSLASLRIDGGMAENAVFVQALADAAGRPVEVSPHREATTVGAAYLAGVGAGIWSDLDEAGQLWSPRAVVDPAGRRDRDRWRGAVDRARGWLPGLSDISF